MKNRLMKVLGMSMTPAKMIAKSNKALAAFKRTVTKLEKHNVTIQEEMDAGLEAIKALQEQQATITAVNGLYANISQSNAKKITKISTWLEG